MSENGHQRTNRNRVYLNGELAELAYLQSRHEGLGLSAWVNKVVAGKLVQLGEEARRSQASEAPPS